MADTTRHDRLVADRDRLEAAMDDAAPRELPSLVREHRAVLKEIEALSKPKEGSTRDQLAARRAAREAGATGTPAAGVR